MRKILFRAKGQTSGKWREGLLTRLDKDVCHIKDNRHNEWICNPSTICQYTGFKDDTGKRIFEGDIVGFEDTTSTESGYSEMGCCGKVGYDEEKACFYVTNRLSAESWEVLRECHIIGNIFDNSGLIN